MNKQPELEVDKDGNKFWILNRELYREDGPAIEWFDGDREWVINGKLHRTDGPAVEYRDGRQSWYLNGKRYYSKENWFRALTSEQQLNYLWNLDE
jgi:hypothetical protein